MTIKLIKLYQTFVCSLNLLTCWRHFHFFSQDNKKKQTKFRRNDKCLWWFFFPSSLLSEFFNRFFFNAFISRWKIYIWRTYIDIEAFRYPLIDEYSFIFYRKTFSLSIFSLPSILLTYLPPFQMEEQIFIDVKKRQRLIFNINLLWGWHRSHWSSISNRTTVKEK